VNETRIPIALFCQVEQVTDHSERTVLPSRLHQQGQVVGRSLNGIYVCFPGNRVVSLRPELLRMLDDEPGGD
jgi:hypothetical protein